MSSRNWQVMTVEKIEMTECSPPEVFVINASVINRRGFSTLNPAEVIRYRPPKWCPEWYAEWREILARVFEDPAVSIYEVCGGPCKGAVVVAFNDRGRALPSHRAVAETVVDLVAAAMQEGA